MRRDEALQNARFQFACVESAFVHRLADRLFMLSVAHKLRPNGTSCLCRSTDAGPRPPLGSHCDNARVPCAETKHLEPQPATIARIESGPIRVVRARVRPNATSHAPSCRSRPSAFARVVQRYRAGAETKHREPHAAMTVHVESALLFDSQSAGRAHVRSQLAYHRKGVCGACTFCRSRPSASACFARRTRGR